MHATKVAKIKRSFVLSATQVRRICEVLASHSGECAISVKCAGDLTLRLSSLEELLTINNIGTNKIKTLTLGKGWRSPSSEVTFSVDWGAPVEISIAGENDQVVQTFDRLENAIAPSLRYSWPSFFEIFIDGDARPLSFMLTFILVGAPLGIVIGRAATIRILKLSDPAIMLSSVFICVLALLPFVGHFAFTKVFPKGIFLIGAGEEEYSEVKSRRQFFSPLFIVATVILGIVCAWIAHLIRL